MINLSDGVKEINSIQLLIDYFCDITGLRAVTTRLLCQKDISEPRLRFCWLASSKITVSPIIRKISSEARLRHYWLASSKLQDSDITGLRAVNLQDFDITSLRVVNYKNLLKLLACLRATNYKKFYSCTFLRNQLCL